MNIIQRFINLFRKRYEVTIYTGKLITIKGNLAPFKESEFKQFYTRHNAVKYLKEMKKTNKDKITTIEKL